MLNGVSFSVGESEAVGTERPNAGRVVFCGGNVTRAGPARRCRLGVARAHQVPKPFGDMTVFENVFVGASAGRRGRRRDAYARTIDVLDRCDMLRVANRIAESLGLLHRKRLELARALATEPEVLLRIWGTVVDRFGVRLLPVGYRLRDTAPPAEVAEVEPA